MPCRYNKRRIWMHRIMLEAAQYKHCCFMTLTYDDEHLPQDGSLAPGDMQAFMKRLRSRVAPERLRFFLVGEYGDTTKRPHYHVALFNFESCRYGQSRYTKIQARCCDRCELVRETWGKGNIYLGTLEDDSAGYLAGYVTKKMTHKDDPRLEGRAPEFGRMSLRPGIGYGALWEIADALLRYELDLSMVDVPEQLRHGMKKLPLGRYLRRKLRLMIGRDEKISQEAVYQIAAELLPVRLAARNDAENPSLTKKIVELNAGRLRNFEARQRIFGQRKDKL